ncbi:hypothetical protein JJV70_09545 [Streptomyces sp. JJ66]|uniref:hypothetical protein n=1 Tax=Streptomyces sp. JJ66 TaxID=2803843 RepID=UPI001C588527|nr:hypothetical protein [Streptomyces sp. JJ66]MBW1602349.1 hypothetical protein [Streptomyces sp. JJ66]
MFRIRTAVAAVAIAGVGVLGSAGTAAACAQHHYGDKYGDKYEETNVFKQKNTLVGNCNSVTTQIGLLNANYGGPVCISFVDYDD